MGSFYSSAAFEQNYFYQSAFEKYTRRLWQFMYWRNGTFLPPHKKQQFIEQFVKEERQNFYEKGLFHLPSVQFAVTTRCTLSCRDCSVMMPRFRGGSHIESTFKEFKSDLDAILAQVDSIGTLLLLGGEPLLHDELPEMLSYAAMQDKIELVSIVSNCTLLPSARLLEAARAWAHKVFFGLSNYTSNPCLEAVIKHGEIVEILKSNGIKHSLDKKDAEWFVFELKKCDYNNEQMRDIFARCHWRHCLYALGGILAVCPRSLVGHKLGAFTLGEKDRIDLRAENTVSIREQLLSCYAKDYLEACRYCLRHERHVPAAIQIAK